MDPEELDRLVARAQEGDVRAFEALVAAHAAQVRRFARAFARTEADADDLAQDALVRVYRGLGGYRHQAAFSTWLFSVVRSACLDASKGAARRREREEPLDREHLREPGGARPDETAEAESERRRVWAALRLVPADYRSAVVLFDLEGLTYDEVAAIERVPVGTVKSRLARGRAHLRTALADADPAPSGTPEAVASSHPMRRS